MSAARRVVSLALLSTIAGAPAPASAAEPPVSFGVGVAGAAGVAGFEAPGTVALPDSGDTVRLPAFSGPGASGGLALEARALGIVGLEVGALYTAESLEATARREGAATTVSVSQPTVRVPLLLKGLWPLGMFSPFLAAGVEFVVFGLSSVDTSPAGDLRAVASAAPPLGFLVGAGVEWRVPLEVVDLRVPLGVRLGLAGEGPGEPRAIALPSDALVLESTPSHRIELSTGAGLWF